MSKKFNTDDLVAMDFACKVIFGSSYAEFMNTLVEVGGVLLNFVRQQDETGARELPAQETAEMPAPIGFQPA